MSLKPEEELRSGLIAYSELGRVFARICEVASPDNLHRLLLVGWVMGQMAVFTPEQLENSLDRVVRTVDNQKLSNSDLNILFGMVTGNYWAPVAQQLQ
jgi:hypothetical protein